MGVLGLYLKVHSKENLHRANIMVGATNRLIPKGAFKKSLKEK